MNPRVIGVVLAGHLGDVILRSAVLGPLRRRFADAEILLIASRFGRELFADSRHVDRTVDIAELRLGPWKKFPRPVARTLANLTRDRWAPALEVGMLVFPGHLTSHVELDLLDLVACEQSIGHVGGPHVDGEKLSAARPEWEKRITIPMPLPGNYQSSHLLAHISRMLGALSCDVSEAQSLRVEIGIEVKDRNAANLLTSSLSQQAYGVIFSGASFNRAIKMWPLDRFADVVGQLRRRLGSWVICGSQAERSDCSHLADLIRSRCPGIEVATICGAPVRQVAAMLERAKLVIGNDNGGMHLAVALDRPTASIVSGASRRLYFPWGDPERHRAIAYELDCWGCSFNCRQSSVLCMTMISAARVVGECLSVLDAHERIAGGAHA
jgi:ADP-heptose:LPS heptosyltransferase